MQVGRANSKDGVGGAATVTSENAGMIPTSPTVQPRRAPCSPPRWFSRLRGGQWWERAHQPPQDLAEFYEPCGGIEFLDTPQHYGVIISPPAQLLPTNPILIGEQVDDDITSSWYVIGHAFSSDLISIDLHPARRP